MKQLLGTLLKWTSTAFCSAGTLVFSLLASSVASVFVVGRDVAAGVTTERVEQVRRGMSVPQLLAVLGRPYHVSSYKGSGTHRIDNCHGAEASEGVVSAEVSDTLHVEALLWRAAADSTVHKCDIGDFRAHDRNTTLTYSRPVAGVGSYPMLWVHLDSTAHVSSVFVKEYTPYFFLEDDFAFYSDAPELAANPGRHEMMRRLFGR